MIIGIDPGLSGAYAVYKNKLWQVYDIPLVVEKKGKKIKRNIDVNTLVQEFRGATQREAYAKSGEDINVVVGLEEIHAMPGQGVSSMFSFGKGYGIWLGILGSLDYPVQFVTPQKWKKHFQLIGKSKDAARVLAQKLFPAIELDRRKDIGRADSLLIAKYLQETHAHLQ